MVEAIVEFDYQAQHDDELTISVGEVITNIRKEDGGWWEGQINGRRGLFPDNFVREIRKDMKKDLLSNKAPEKPMHDVSSGNSLLSSETILRTNKRGERRRRRCQVAFSYLPQNDDELELKVGDIIEVVGEVEEGWWEGVLNGKTGMFPSNFIKELSGESDELGISQDEQLSKSSLPVIISQTWLTDWSDSPKIDLAGSTLSGILDKDLSDRSNDIDLEGFDSVISSTEKLSHPTTSRPKATGRRPPSQSLTSSSLSSPDIFDSPSPEEDKEEHISLAHRGIDVSKKTSKTVTISQVSDNKASLPPKPGTMAAASSGPPSLSSVASSPMSSSLGTAGQRASSPSLFSTEGKPKLEPAVSSQAAIEELKMQVRELRTIIETMKDQQKREIKQLLSELDEEKKIRLRLQMEVNDIKKALQSK
ncbi:SH3 domain-containing kinase-binding protein 1 [Apodemus sylvaticus]|uniref:SH3 domain-containing kinase-binding protein 1 n=1 Tax=Apodemus sylvaticus TaxID=10129 RepID=UPI002243EE1A|nr:SH3 domain-containing kinase-binding protein 1 [Apodemus sylvaticus]